MFKPEFLILKKRISCEKKSIYRNTNISRNLERIIENYSQNKSSKFVKKTQKSTLTLQMFNTLKNFSFLYKLINKKLVNKNLTFHFNMSGLTYVKNTFSEKSKQKFKSFLDFSIYYENKFFTNFLECVLHKFRFHSNFQQYIDQDKILEKSKNYKEIRKISGYSNQTKLPLLVRPQTGDAFFSNFLQSFVSQTYLKKDRKKEFCKKTFLSLNTEKITSSIEVSLNSYYIEIWKENSYSDFSNFLNKRKLLGLELNTENLKFETLLNLFYVYIKLTLPTYIKQNISEKKSNLSTSDVDFSKPLLQKISKRNTYNFYRLKKLFYKFYYFYFLVFSLKTYPLNFQNFLLENFFQVSAVTKFRIVNITRVEKFKTKFKFPNFIQNLETSCLTLSQVSSTKDASLNNFIIVEKILNNNLSFFVKFVYCNVTSFQDISFLLKIKVFCFIINFSIAYRNFKNFKTPNTLNSNLNGSIYNPNYLNIEKLFFEILQKLTLKNEKSVTVNQINKNFIFYFSPLNEKIYFVCSCPNLENLEKYFLLFQFFNIWTEKNYLLNLKNLNSIYFTLLLSYDLSLFTNRINHIVLNYKQIYNLCYINECLFTKNLNESFLTFNFVNTSLNQIKKFTYTKKIKQTIKIYSSQAQENLISKLAPYILSWTYLFRFKLKKSDWNELDKILSQFIWRWACRRHNNKSKKWIQSKYFFTLNKELWFFGQMGTDSFIEPKTKETVNFVYLPFHGQISYFLYASEKCSNKFQ